MDYVKKYSRILLNIWIPLMLWILACILIPKLLSFFMPFVIGWLLAMMANPLVRMMEKHIKLTRKYGSVVITVAALALVITLIYLVIIKLAGELSGFISDFPRIYGTVSADVKEAWSQIEHLFEFLPQKLQDSLTQFTENLGSMVTALVQDFAMPTVEVAGNVAKKIPNALVYFIITILSSYFFLAEREVILEFIKKHMPKAVHDYMGYFKKDVKHLIGGYFAAQFKIMFVVAVVLAVGFFILQVDYAALLAVLVAILDFLPIFGTGTVLIPWAVLKVLSGEYAFAAGLALLYVATQVVRQLIQPKIVGDTMGIPPLMTLFLLFLGFKFKGIAGMILAVPVGLVVINLCKYGAFDSIIVNVKILIHDIQEFRKQKE